MSSGRLCSVGPRPAPRSCDENPAGSNSRCWPESPPVERSLRREPPSARRTQFLRMQTDEHRSVRRSLAAERVCDDPLLTDCRAEWGNRHLSRRPRRRPLVYPAGELGRSAVHDGQVRRSRPDERFRARFHFLGVEPGTALYRRSRRCAKSVIGDVVGVAA